MLTRIVANDRVATSAQLPTVAVTNIRSIGPKAKNFTEDFLQHELTACLISESWEKQTGTKKFKQKLETMF